MDSRITTANEAGAPRFARYRYRHGENAVQGGQTPTQGPGDNGNKKKEAPRHNRNDVSRLRGFHETP